MFVHVCSSCPHVALRLLPGNRWRRAARDSLKALEAAKGISFKLSENGHGWKWNEMDRCHPPLMSRDGRSWIDESGLGEVLKLEPVDETILQADFKVLS